MILSILKFVVKAIVIILTTGAALVQMLAVLIKDMLAQAKAATPSTVETLKSEAQTTASKAPDFARKINADLRKVFKIADEKESDVTMASAATKIRIPSNEVQILN